MPGRAERGAKERGVCQPGLLDQVAIQVEC